MGSPERPAKLTVREGIIPMQALAIRPAATRLIDPHHDAHPRLGRNHTQTNANFPIQNQKHP